LQVRQQTQTAGLVIFSQRLLLSLEKSSLGEAVFIYESSATIPLNTERKVLSGGGMYIAVGKPAILPHNFSVALGNIADI